jgi:hypothetical protein
MDTLLTIEELKKIELDAQNPIYKNQLLLHMGNNKTDIIRVSTLHNLVFIRGNTKTGFYHINERHGNQYEKPFWKKEKGKNILGNPSQFSSNTIPILDYISIADQLFTPDNLNIKKNTNKKHTDLYQGKADIKHIGQVPYRLILYKNTRIVHNLYPITSEFTNKWKINYFRGNISMSSKFINDISTINIPYLNHNDIIIYEVILRYSENIKKEKLYIQKNNENGDPFITHYYGQREVEYDIHNQFFLNQFQYGDLSYFEKLILEIDNN